MTTDLPAPPVPPDVDLTDFKFMPLEVARLRRSRSWLICRRRPDVGFYMLNLWAMSWHELPAGSLEDDDDVLADAAMCSPEKWSEVKAEVLRGWLKCNDGRLYHRVVVEKVAESWNQKLTKRWRNECDRIRKENYSREKRHEPLLNLPPKPELAAFVWPSNCGTASGLAEIQNLPQESGGPPAEPAPIPAENALKGIDRKGPDRTGTEGTGPDIDSSLVDASGADRGEPQPNLPIEGGSSRAIRRSSAAALAQAVLDAWNETAERVNAELGRSEFQTAQKVTDKRQRLALARLKEAGGIDGIRVAFERWSRDRWARGETPRKPEHAAWRISLDYVLSESAFTKIMERNDDSDAAEAARRQQQSRRRDDDHEARAQAILGAKAW
jgi:hypothetical protein